MVITTRNFDLKRSNLKMAEKSRVIILALAGEELLGFFYYIYPESTVLYDEVTHCLDCCFLFSFLVFNNPGATLKDFNFQMVWEDVNNNTNSYG